MPVVILQMKLAQLQMLCLWYVAFAGMVHVCLMMGYAIDYMEINK